MSQGKPLFILFSFLFVLSVRLGYSQRACLSVHETEGRCVSFENCPPFLDMLKSAKAGEITIDKLRLLQRLTCGFDRNDPMICCPNSEIYPPIFDTQSQNKIKPINRDPDAPPPRPHTTIAPKRPGNNIYRVTTTSRPSVINSKVTPSKVDPHNRFSSKIGLRSHNNFQLIPSLKNCSNTVNSDRIVGGTEAALGSYPWMARIGYLNLDTGDVEFYCGGTVINSRYILTAAHCTEEIDEEYKPVVVRLGEHDVTTEEDCSPEIGCIKYTDYVIEKVIPHKQYQKDDKSNDIELIRVTRDISFESFAVRPVCLPFKSEYNIDASWEKALSPKPPRPIKTWVAGWGRTRWNKADGSNTLQEVQLPLVSNEQCRFNYSTRVEVTENQICAGGIKNKDSCGGDSGGPLMFPLELNHETKFFQLGVVSFGPVQCGQSAGLPGVYTRTTSYLKWILDNIEP